MLYKEDFELGNYQECFFIYWAHLYFDQWKKNVFLKLFLYLNLLLSLI